MYQKKKVNATNACDKARRTDGHNHFFTCGCALLSLVTKQK